jgi:putative SOS response-associated peptidase YedK
MQVPIIAQNNDGANVLMGARWGLIPHWWRESIPPQKTFNARSEEASQKRMWKGALAARRCIMPAIGWYEFNEAEPVRNRKGNLVNQPYFHSSPTSPVIAIAGIWSEWDRAEQLPIISCALLTKGAGKSVEAIHHRMPVILKPEHYDAWLNPDTSKKEIETIIDDSRDDFVYWAVSTDVGNSRNDFPELLKDLRAEEDFFLDHDIP